MNFLTYNFFGMKPKAFGLEIKSSSIKAVALEKKRNAFHLLSCGRRIPPRGVVQVEQIVDTKKLAEEIKTLLASSQPNPIKMKNVVISIPEAKAFIRTIEIPKMPNEEAREAVKWETEANIPVSLDRVYLDWQVISSGGEKDEVLVVAVPKNIVDSYYEAITMAGLYPLAFEVDVIATIRSLTRLLENKNPLLIADIGAENTSLAICRDQIPYFTSSIPLSGDAFTEAIQKEMGVGWEKAEEIKFKFGVDQKENGELLKKIFNPLTENLASEIEKSINFFAESINKKEKVEKIILSGGGALLADLSRYLGERLNKEVVLGDPSGQIDTRKFSYEISSNDLLPYSTAIGLALRGADYEN